MGGEYDTHGSVKEKLNEGTESIKHCTATAEWCDVSNVVWQRDRFMEHRDKKKKKKNRDWLGKVKDRQRGYFLLQERNTLVKRNKTYSTQSKETLITRQSRRLICRFKG